MARTSYSTHLSVSPNFTQWLEREKKLAMRRQGLIRSFVIALLFMLITAVLFSKFDNTSTNVDVESYTNVE